MVDELPFLRFETFDVDPENLKSAARGPGIQLPARIHSLRFDVVLVAVAQMERLQLECRESLGKRRRVPFQRDRGAGKMERVEIREVFEDLRRFVRRLINEGEVLDAGSDGAEFGLGRRLLAVAWKIWSSEYSSDEPSEELLCGVQVDRETAELGRGSGRIVVESLVDDLNVLGVVEPTDGVQVPEIEMAEAVRVVFELEIGLLRAVPRDRLQDSVVSVQTPLDPLRKREDPLRKCAPRRGRSAPG